MNNNKQQKNNNFLKYLTIYAINSSIILFQEIKYKTYIIFFTLIVIDLIFLIEQFNLSFNIRELFKYLNLALDI